jgi:predicted Zn-dependent protease
MRYALTTITAAALLAAACAVNPATGRRQISLVPEGSEVEIGRQADREIVASIGLYDDAEAQAYVSALGKKLAASSERPNLPWSFKVVDDPTVNAFALPGGFIYVTRGLMTHLQSEAELVAVLGHEIGHVTARHGADQMTKAQLANIGLGVGAIVTGREDIVGMASQGLQLLFLKYGRDDERQADDLGLRYLIRGGYDPQPMVEVLDTLERVSAAQGGGGRLPTWLSTHPAPGDRRSWAQAKIAELKHDFSSAQVGRERYLQVVDGMVYGANPRNGYFRGSTFVQPELAFAIDFPSGWKTQNSASAVGAISPNQDAIVRVTISKQSTPAAAAREFASTSGVQAGQPSRRDVHGLAATSLDFHASTQQGAVAGVATFVQHGGRVYAILAYTPQGRWQTYEAAFMRSVGSFRRATDAQARAVNPMRIELTTPRSSMTVAEFARQTSPGVKPETVALVNHRNLNDRVAPGTPLKSIVGESPA